MKFDNSENYYSFLFVIGCVIDFGLIVSTFQINNALQSKLKVD